jgi:cation transport regulator ChaC
MSDEEEEGLCSGCGSPHGLPNEIMEKRKSMSPRENNILNCVAIMSILEGVLHAEEMSKALKQALVMMGDMSEEEYEQAVDTHNFFADIFAAKRGDYELSLEDLSNGAG